MELQNSTVLVTGSTGNMGPYVTDRLVNRDVDVIGTYVTETERDDVGTRAEHADAVSYHRVDLTDQAAVLHLLSNEGVTGQVVQMTGGQPEGAA